MAELCCSIKWWHCRDKRENPMSCVFHGLCTKSSYSLFYFLEQDGHFVSTGCISIHDSTHWSITSPCTGLHPVLFLITGKKKCFCVTWVIIQTGFQREDGCVLLEINFTNEMLMHKKKKAYKTGKPTK